MGTFFSSSTTEDDGWKSDARYAMESGTYCVICGAPFDIEGDVYNLDPKEPRYQWLLNFRLLGRSEDLNTHRITSGSSEPNNTSQHQEIFLSEKAEFRTAGYGAFRLLDENGSDDIWYNPLWHSRNSSDTLFPLHEACVETSCRAIDHVRSRQGYSDNEPTLVTLYRFLNSRFIDRHTKTHPEDDTTNDIFDLCHWSKIHGPRSVLALTRLEWWGGGYDCFYADPIDVPDIEAFVFDVLLASSQQPSANVHTTASAQEPQGIERMPNELLDAISHYLPTDSIIKLRRTSKTMATKLPLDNTFWRESLRTGSLHPHIWGLDTKGIETLRKSSIITFSTADWDWKTVAKLLATKQFPVAGCDPRLESMPPGLWNRCRIWSIIEMAFKYDCTEDQFRQRSDSCIELRAKQTS